MRGEFTSIQSAFNLLPNFVGNPNTFVVVNGSGTGLTVIAGLVFTMNTFNVTMVANASVTLQLPSSSGTLALTTDVTTIVDNTIGGTAIRSYLAGLQMTSSTTTTFTVGAGVAADDTNAVMMQGAGGTINCAITGANGLDTGSLAAGTWYHWFIIATAAGATAYLASLNLSPAMPATYTSKRRLGSFKTGGSAHILAMTQFGDLFQWIATALDYNNNPGANTTTNVTLSVAPGVAVLAQLHIFGNAGNSSAIDVYTPGQTQSNLLAGATGNGTNGQFGTFAEILTNTSSQVVLSVGNTPGGTSMQLATYGWKDRRGRDA
jgi:hypothetical protein